MDLIKSHHHLTLSVGGAQEDYDFHTGLLGLRSVKKTVLFDGKLPIYHLYYGNYTGDPGTLITCFAFRQAGIKGKKGSGQIRVVNLSVPADSLDYWADRLQRFGLEHQRFERFGAPGIHFEHPCGIEYELIGEDDDQREPYVNGDVPAEAAVRGLHGITVSVKELEQQGWFMENAFGARKTAEDGNYTRYEIGRGGPAHIIDHAEEPDVPQGSWIFGEGTVHHCAFDVVGQGQQQQFKEHIEGLGFTDASEEKDRQYFHSVYFRTPGGALFEAAYSTEQGFTIDETVENYGREFQLPPWFEDRREEIMAVLEPIDY
jgi:glyoxalase family protein